MNSWESFFRSKCIEIFNNSENVLDIAGGLRLNTGKSNRVTYENSWLEAYIKKVDYKILDVVPDYKPDIVGDIQNLPFEDDSLDAIICIAILEHVENPILAMNEMYRVLKPKGRILIYVPFLYYYHAQKGYYNDYWRFTSDILKHFAKPFSKYELEAVRLPIETLTRLTPLGRYKLFISLARKLDNVFYSKGSEQVSGYYLYLVK